MQLSRRRARPVKEYLRLALGARPHSGLGEHLIASLDPQLIEFL